MKQNILIIIILLFVAQFILLSIALPITEIRSDKPFLQVDSPYHIYQIYIAKQLGKEGFLQGYDPFFSAGYVAGISKNHSAHFPALFTAFLSPDSDPFVAYKVYYFISACAAAIMIPIAAYVLGSGTIAAAISGFIAILLWWNSDLRITHNSGMVSSVLSAYWGTAFGAALLASCRIRFEFLSSISLSLIGALGFLYYPFFPIVVAFTVMPGLIILRSEYSIAPKVYLFFTVIIISLVANLFWIIPSFSDRQLVDVSTSFSSKPEPWQFFNLTFGRMTIINAAVLLSASYGVTFIANIKYRRIAWVFFVAGILVILYASFGAYISIIAKLQSNRFLPFSFIVMTPAAGLGIIQMFSDINYYTGLRRFFTITIIFGVALVGINALRETYQEVTYDNVPRRGLPPPEVRGEGPATAWLRGWIETNSFGDSRILFEHSGNPVYDRTYISSYLGMQTKREFANYGFQLQVPTGFGNGWLFGKDINEYKSDELQQLLWTYNVGWVVTTEERTVTAFKNLPEAKLLASRGSINIFGLKNSPGLFMKGSGKISLRAINRLVLDDLRGEDVIIRYNYFDCLKTSPITSIEPVIVPYAYYPFIRLRNPPQTVTLSCS